jgi:RNA polymerase sigma-70 factor, ECF subfamily
MTADTVQLEVSVVATDDQDPVQRPMEAADSVPNPEQFYCQSELREVLIRFLEKMSPMLRTVFVLRDVEGLSTEQAAETLNLSRAAVKVRLWRVRLQFRECLNEHLRQQTDSAQGQLMSSSSYAGRLPDLCAESIFSEVLD